MECQYQVGNRQRATLVVLHRLGAVVVSVHQCGTHERNRRAMCGIMMPWRWSGCHFGHNQCWTSQPGFVAKHAVHAPAEWVETHCIDESDAPHWHLRTTMAVPTECSTAHPPLLAEACSALEDLLALLAVPAIVPRE